jgi:hypothetical protein
MPLDLRRGTLSAVSIVAPLIVGLLAGQAGGGLAGAIAGLLLTLSDTDGPLAPRLGTTLGVALGIAAGGALGAWLAAEKAMFWVAFFAAVFAAGLLNQVGKGPHFAVRFGAVALAAIAGLPQLSPEIVWYFAGTVVFCLLAKLVDQLINGPLSESAPWPGSISAPMAHWLRFALAYALAATLGLWIGVQSAAVRAVWIAAIVLVFMLPDVRLTYRRTAEGVIGAALAVFMVWLLTLATPSEAVRVGAILVFAFVLPSQLARFWLFSGLVAAVVLIAWDLASGDPYLEPVLLWERFVDTLIAVPLAAGSTLLFFPRESWTYLGAVMTRARGEAA